MFLRRRLGDLRSYFAKGAAIFKPGYQGGGFLEGVLNFYSTTLWGYEKFESNF